MIECDVDGRRDDVEDLGRRWWRIRRLDPRELLEREVIGGPHDETRIAREVGDVIVVMIAIECGHRRGAGGGLDEMRDRTAHAAGVDERGQEAVVGLARGKLPAAT